MKRRRGGGEREYIRQCEWQTKFCAVQTIKIDFREISRAANIVAEILDFVRRTDATLNYLPIQHV